MKIVKNGQLVDFIFPINIDSIQEATENSKGLMTKEQVQKLIQISKSGRNAPMWR